ILSGGVGYAPALQAMIQGLLRRRSASPERSDAPVLDTRAALRALSARGMRILHVYVEADEGLDYLQTGLGPDWRAPRGPGGGEVRVILGANHQFTGGFSREELIRAVEEWMLGFETIAA